MTSKYRRYEEFLASEYAGFFGDDDTPLDTGVDMQENQMRYYNTPLHGGGVGEYIHVKPEDNVLPDIERLGIILPKPGTSNVYFMIVSKLLTPNNTTGELPIILTTAYTSGTIYGVLWSQASNDWDRCHHIKNNTELSSLVTAIEAFMGKSDLPKSFPLPPVYSGDNPNNNEGGTQGSSNQGTAPMNTGSMSVDPNAPGGFGAGIPQLPHAPGWFKTPAGFCRRWAPWERAIVQLAQKRARHENELYAEKYGCMPGRKSCKTTACY